VREHRVFRAAWWSANALLIAAIALLCFAAGWEYSVRRYLKGFSDAIVPKVASPEEKVEAILEWMRHGPSRDSGTRLGGLAVRDPENTLNYRELLQVCGTATNAFLNVGDSAGLPVRRLLLLGPDRRAIHVVAEVLIDKRWVVVDPAYHVMLRDARGQLLTREQLHSPVLLEQARSTIRGYPPAYDFDRAAHIRLARIPLIGLGLGRVLDRVYPGWEERFNWSLIVERESVVLVLVACSATFFLVLARGALAWYADRRLHIARVHFRRQLCRAGTALVSNPGLK
jgi:hypothetical protein